jgi:NAD(P)-dependent dehydrogenase (short-subunit alcohol dehydrogenase family)
MQRFVMRTVETKSFLKNDELVGKVVLVCRAGLELGRVISESYAQCGASLALHDYSPIHLDSTLKRVQNIGATAEDFIADISKKIPAQVMMDQIGAKFGTVDILINIPAVHPHQSILEMDEWDWQRTLEMNVNAAFLMTQLAGREMQKNGGGLILNLINGCMDPPKSHTSAFVTSMTALAGFGQAAATELSSQNIRVYNLLVDLTRGFDQFSCEERKSPSLIEWQEQEQIKINRIASWVLFLSVQYAQVSVGQIIDTNWGTPWV